MRCPTPVFPHRPLIFHHISKGTCSKRQGELYHKCFSCLNSTLEQARLVQLFQERMVEGEEPTRVIGPVAWPALPDATIPQAEPTSLSRAVSDGRRS
ncbi:MAG TPA: hypothetical protein VKF62_14735 [Planctomycetota bacterium]|nr:hypothetical protein [Planctomycetota bacterium]